MKGKCHDALIGEWVNWWLERKIDGMIFNPARGSKSGSRRYVADLMFLERFKGSEYFEVKGIAEIENNEEKLSEKTNSLVSYENYSKQGCKVYPDLEFAILCYRLDIPNDALAQGIYNRIVEKSESSDLLWIVCEIARSLNKDGKPQYLIHMPGHVKGADSFWYYRNFSSVIFYCIKNGKQIEDIIVPGVSSK